MKRPLAILTFAIVTAAALLLLIGGGATSDTSEGASTVIDGTTVTWISLGTPIVLNDGDTLTINAAAGSPTNPTLIKIEANANVTITGNINTITNLYIKESTADTLAHTVNLTNLKYTAPTGQYAYEGQKGVITLTGINSMTGNGTYAFSAINTRFAGDGSLAINGAGTVALNCYTIELRQTAFVTATTASSGTAIQLLGSPVSDMVDLAAGTTLSASNTLNSPNASAFAFASPGTHTLICNGFFIANATGTQGRGLYCAGTQLNISGSGNINAYGSTHGAYLLAHVSIFGTNVEFTGGLTGLYTDNKQVSLTNNAKLSSTGSNSVAVDSTTTFRMTPTSTVNLRNGGAAAEIHSFTMNTAGNWSLTNASFVSPSTATSTTANISVDGGGLIIGTIKLLPPPTTAPGITGPTSMTLTAGYAATSTDVYTLTGNPAPNISVFGDPKIAWNNSTKKLDIAAGLAAGSYPVTLTAFNGTPPDAPLTFTLTVNPSGGGTTAPGITGPNSMIVTAGYGATSTAAFTLTGSPAPTVTLTGDSKITWNNSTKKLDIATGLAAGTHVVNMKASNGTPPDANFTFTLIVNPSGGATPTVTSVSIAPPSASVAKGATQAFTATVTGTNSPSQAVTWEVTGKTDANTAISSAGLLTVGAAETAASLSVKATSILDPTKSDTVTVTVISGTSGGDGGEDGGSNTMLYVAIIIVIVVVVLALLYFFVIKKKP